MWLNLVEIKRLRQKSRQTTHGCLCRDGNVVHTGFDHLLHHVRTTCLEYENILIGPDTVYKWVIEVANHAGRLHLVRSMPWAAMLATELQSLLRVV
jgi:hypothetical protein